MNPEHSTSMNLHPSGGSSSALRLLKLLILLLTVSATTACEKDDPTNNKLAPGTTACAEDKDCQLSGGVCDTTQGICVNPSGECNDTTAKCVPGYECKAPKGKTKKTCTKVLCTTPCEQGECAPKLDKKGKPYCVSKKTCKVEDESLSRVSKDCVEGDFCYNGTCQSKQDVSDILNCGNDDGHGHINYGVFDPKTGTCVDAEHCENNYQCTTGLCNTAGKCLPNSCGPDSKACETGGVCVRDSSSDNGFRCESKSTCERALDCAFGEICVKQSGENEGKCLPRKQLPLVCKPACAGNQQCKYDTTSLVAECKENESGCQHPIDCLGENVCDSSHACVRSNDTCDDANNGDKFDKDSNLPTTITDSNATDFQNLSICGDDTDSYTFDAENGNSDKTLLVTVTIPDNDVNVRELILEVTNGSGTTVTKTNIVNGKTTKAIDVAIPQPIGTYTIKVKGNEQQNKPVRVHYDLNAKLVDVNSVQVCAENHIKTLVPDQRVNGSFSTGTQTTGLATRCMTKSESAYSHVYKLEITERSYTVISLVPSGGGLGLSIRSSCYSKESELTCVESSGRNQEKQFKSVLEPGIYYVAVTANSLTEQADSYELVAETTATECTDSTAPVCVGGNYLRKCNETQTGYERDDCGGAGCATVGDTGVCKGRKGDSCLNPLQVPTSTGRVTETDVRTNEGDVYKNTYETTCANVKSIPANFHDLTTGKELLYQAHVESGYAIVGNVNGSGRKSVYIVDDCLQQNNQCIAAFAEKYEDTRLDFFWKNEDSDAKDVVIIIDRAYHTYNQGSINYDIRIEEPECTPGQTKCDASPNDNTLLTCNRDATGWDSYTCQNSCTGSEPEAKCENEPTAQDCNSPKTVVFSGNTSTYHLDLRDPKLSTDTNSIRPANASVAGCGNIKYHAADENDAVFKLHAEQGQLYTITATPTSESGGVRPTIWLAKADGTTCSSGAIQSNECLDGAVSPPGRSAQLTFAPETTGDYFLVATTGEIKSSAQRYPKLIDLTFTKETVDSSKALTVKGCENGEMVYYDSYGREKRYTCTCTNDEKECTDRSGDNCPSAIEVNGTSKKSAGSNGSLTDQEISPSNDSELGYLRNPKERFRLDRCMFNEDVLGDAPRGADKFYKFTLGHGTTLKVDFKIKDASNKEALVAFFQEKEHCGDPKSCMGSIGGEGNQTLYYKNTTNGDTVVYLVVKYVKPLYANPFALSKVPFELEWSLTDSSSGPYSCAPGERVCDGTNNLKECHLSGLGTASERTFTCSNGCKDGFCQLPATTGTGTSCSNPLDVGTGGIFYIGSDVQRGTGSNLSNACSTRLEGDDTNHYFLKVHATRGKLITVTSASPSEDSYKVILFRGCDADSTVCLRGDKGFASPLSKNQRTISYIADQDADYLIDLVSVNYSNEATPFLVSLNVSDVECQETDKSSCTDGIVTYCNYGQKQAHQCTPKECSPTSASCKTPDGGICSEAIKLVPNAQGKGTTKGKITSTVSHTYINFDHGVSGACIHNENALLSSSGEKYYTIHLEKGETFRATLTDNDQYGSSNYYLFLLKNCSTQCTASYQKDLTTTLKKYMTFTAHERGDYTLVIDSTKPLGEQAGFKLDYSVNKEDLCIPGSGYCENTNTLVTCDSAHRRVEVSCTCKFGYCESEIAKIDSCTEAKKNAAVVDATHPNYSTIVPVMQLANNDHSGGTTQAEGQVCAFNSDQWRRNIPKGNDAFYKVIVPVNRTLRAEVTGGNKSANVGLYLTRGCGTSTPLEECIAAGLQEATYNDTPNAFEYTNTTGSEETLYVGVDSIISGWSPDEIPENLPRVLNIELKATTCDPTTMQPVCKSNQLTYCNPLIKFPETIACTCTDNATSCSTPKGELCADAIDITPTNGQVTKTVTGDLSTGNHANKVELNGEGLCSAVSNSAGEDIIYKVTVPKGKYASLTLNSTSTAQQTLSLYVVQDCYNAANTCMKAAEGQNVTIELDSPKKDKTYFIYVDSPDIITSDGNFSLKVDFN